MNHILDCKCKLAEVMRTTIPLAGIDFKNMIMVDLKAGEHIGNHAHTYHTALYYPADAAPIVVTPLAGMIIYLPPGTPHAVPKVDAPRISVGMLVEP